jgi:23S rRNA pseudouridine1911/1915/1917 synthase
VALELEVGAEGAGLRLDVFVGGHVASRSAAQALIEGGHVTVDGTHQPKRHVLAGGERVVVDPPEPQDEPDVPDAGFAVLHEDDDVLVVDKPAGVVVHPARGHRRGTLAQALAGRIAGGEDPERAGIVHRLDRDTSGLLVVARSEAAHAALKAQMQARGITREYLALVEGRPAARTGTIDAPLAATGACAPGSRPTPTSRGRRARTSPSIGPCRRPRCCGSRSRRAARTRSAPI